MLLVVFYMMVMTIWCHLDRVSIRILVCRERPVLVPTSLSTGQRPHFVQRATTRPNDNFDPTFFDPDREVDSVGPEPGSRPSFWRLKTHTPSCLNEYDMLNRQIDTQVGDYSNNTDLNRWSGSGRKLGCDFDWNNNKYAQPLGRSIACATPPSISYTLYKPGLPGAAGNLKLWGLNPETASEGVGGNGGEAYVGFGPVFDTMFGNFPVDPEFPELGQLPRLETGESGFSEPTVVDEFVGDPTSHGYYCEPIVRWITHPFQAIGAEGLPIGIAAHHVEGIDKGCLSGQWWTKTRNYKSN